MVATKSRFFLILLATLNLSNAFGGTHETVQVDPCDDIELVLSNKKHPNPMFEEYHLEVDFQNAINNVFYAVQEGRVVEKTIHVDGKPVVLKYAEIPVYGWFEYTAGTEFLTIFQRQDFFNPCGYVGSTCTPATFARMRAGIAPARRWIPWQDVCVELDHPKNGKGVKRKILREMRVENLYGLLRKKGLPADLPFLDKYSPYVYRDDKMTNENWMSMYDHNGYPAKPGTKAKAEKKTVINPHIQADPEAVEILPMRAPVLSSSPTSSRYQYDTTVTKPRFAPGNPHAPRFPPSFEPGRPYNPSHFVELVPPPLDDHHRIVPMEPAPGVAPHPRFQPVPQYGPDVPPVEANPQYRPTPEAPEEKPAPTPPQVDPDYYEPEEEEMTPAPPARKQQPTPPTIEDDEEPIAPAPMPPTSQNKTKKQSGEPRVAEKVPGKPGFVYFPEKPTMVDVSDYPSGSKVRDPNTHEIFIVP